MKFGWIFISIPFTNVLGTVAKTDALNTLDSSHTEPTFLFSNNQCDDVLIDLCADGSSCEGLKHVFLELCYRPDKQMTDCSTDCSYLLGQLEKEAINEGKALECVSYLQEVPSTCAGEGIDHDDTLSHELKYAMPCPSEDQVTSDLNPGKYEVISCNELYPSGIFGAGSTYRYCMVGGGGAVNTNTCREMNDDDMSVLTDGDRRTLSSFSSRKMEDNDELLVLEGAEQAIEILSDAGSVLEDAGDVFESMEKYGDLAAKIGPALGAIGVGFSILNAFLGGDSDELEFMKQEFGIVNEKLDGLEQQIDDLEEILQSEIYISDFNLFKANIAGCGDYLSMYQASPNEDTLNLANANCCTGDKSPNTFVHWILNDDVLDQVLKSASHDYNMYSLSNRGNTIASTALLAAYFKSFCVGHVLSDVELIKFQMEEQGDRIKNVLSKIESRIKELPNDYISSQLRNDVVEMVNDSSNSEECAQKLKDKISSRMKGWAYSEYSPRPSAYCYDPKTGYFNHGLIYYGTKNEEYGFFKEFRVSNKFSVGIDWNWTPRIIDLDSIKSHIEKKIVENDFSKTLKLRQFRVIRDIVEDHLNTKYGLDLRNIAYIRSANNVAWNGDLSTSYPMEITYTYEDGDDDLTTRKYWLIFSIWPQHYGLTPLVHLGWSPDTSSDKLNSCEGDCDGDADCSDSLRCYQRGSGDTSPPGCSGIPYSIYDYCYDPSPPLKSFGSSPDTSFYKLGLCQGDCDKNSDCDGGLKCFQRGSGDTGPPGCSGIPYSNYDYCYDPSA